MCRNRLADISALAKSAPTLAILEAAGNSISDIGALGVCKELKVLNCGENSISDISIVADMGDLAGLRLARNCIADISALSGLKKLAVLDLGGNGISSVSALSGLTGLAYVDLSSNSISDISALSAIDGTYNVEGAVANVNSLTLYLEHNLITDLSPLPSKPEYRLISVYDNPISDFSPLQELTYGYRMRLYTSYQEQLNAGSLVLPRNDCSYYCVDVPLDRQAQYTSAMDTYNAPCFHTSSEMDELLAEDKAEALSDLIEG